MDPGSDSSEDERPNRNTGEQQPAGLLFTRVSSAQSCCRRQEHNVICSRGNTHYRVRLLAFLPLSVPPACFLKVVHPLATQFSSRRLFPGTADEWSAFVVLSNAITPGFHLPLWVVFTLLTLEVGHKSVHVPCHWFLLCEYSLESASTCFTLYVFEMYTSS